MPPQILTATELGRIADASYATWMRHMKDQSIPVIKNSYDYYGHPVTATSIPNPDNYLAAIYPQSILRVALDADGIKNDILAEGKVLIAGDNHYVFSRSFFMLCHQKDPINFQPVDTYLFHPEFAQAVDLPLRLSLCRRIGSVGNCVADGKPLPTHTFDYGVFHSTLGAQFLVTNIETEKAVTFNLNTLKEHPAVVKNKCHAEDREPWVFLGFVKYVGWECTPKTK